MPVSPPHPIRVVYDLMIPMPDGVRLAANLFIPEGEGPWPAVFQYTPYHKDGRTGLDQEPHHRYFAGQGYAALQVDFRGTGGSEGANLEPMDLQERQDGHHVVEWLAAQPWCTGAVGLWGISYGGITSLSIASTRPPHLKAIIPIHATIDNYEWLLRPHGARGLLLNDVDWGSRMAASNLVPPIVQDPAGEWARRWADRLETNAPWLLSWHGRPPDPDFWPRRRIPYERIEVPTFGICGWYDIYSKPTFMVYDAVQAPKRVLMGPWKHTLADRSPIAPIGGVHEMTRWWDRWLKGIQNGVEHEPPVTLYVRGTESWRHETEWPPARTETRQLYLAEGGALADEPAATATADDYAYDARVGAGAVAYNGHRVSLPLPDDQSVDDHLSLTYTTPPMPEDTEFTGEATLHAVIAADTGELNLVAKLCVVEPTGRSRIIARGWINPARADAHTPPNPLRPGEWREVTVPIRPMAIVLRRGERLRLGLAGADFPELWPTPHPYTLRVRRGGPRAAYLAVPVVPPRAVPLPAPHFEPARTDLNSPMVQGGHETSTIRRDLHTRTVALETENAVDHRIDRQTVLRSLHRATVATDADRPWTTTLRTETRIDLERPIGTVSTRVQTVMTPQAVHIGAEIDIDGQPFFRHAWHRNVDDWVAPPAAVEASPVGVGAGPEQPAAGSIALGVMPG